MRRGSDERFVPGTSVLGGAAAGLSYEGCLRDAMAAEERARHRAAGERRPVPPPQRQAARSPGESEAAAHQAAQQVVA
jgi:hypothetical protein